MINLTIVSENNKTVITKSLSDLSLNSFNSSEFKEIPYDNTLISISQSTSHFNFQKVFDFISPLNSELNFFIFIIVILIIFSGIFGVLKKVK